MSGSLFIGVAALSCVMTLDGGVLALARASDTFSWCCSASATARQLLLMAGAQVYSDVLETEKKPGIFKY